MIETSLDQLVPRDITPATWVSFRRHDPEPAEDPLLPYQRAALKLAEEHSVTVIEKGRRTGLTWAFALHAVLTASAAKGQNVFYMGYNHEMAREFIKTCGDWAKTIGQAFEDIPAMLWDLTDEEGDKAIQVFRIKFASGFQITALPSKARALRGMQGVVIIDEAAFHDDVSEVLKAALALLVWGGSVVVISTHDGEDNAFNEMVQNIRAGRSSYGLMRIDFDQALRDGLYRRVCKVSKRHWTLENEAHYRDSIIQDYGDGADEELFCIPAKGTGVYLNSSLIRASADDRIPVIRYRSPKGFLSWTEAARRQEINHFLHKEIAPLIEAMNPQLKTVFGFDFARVADLSVFWPKQIAPNTHRLTPFVLELRDVPFEHQKQILFFILERLPRLVSGAMDAGGNGAHIAEVVAIHFGLSRIHQIKPSREFYRENSPKLKAAFEDQELNLPLDDGIMSDHRLFKMRNGVAQIPSDQRILDKAAKGERRHGDAAIANLLGEFAYHNIGHEVGYYSWNDEAGEIGDGFDPHGFIGQGMGDFGHARRRGI